MASDFTGRTRGSLGRLESGSRIAGYLIEEQIGAGGMAVVFRARDEVLGRLAAVKIIAPAAAGDEEFRARFLRESRMVAAVDSLHIIPVYGAGEAEGLLYIATRFVAGGDLEALRRRSGGVLAPDRVRALVAQVGYRSQRKRPAHPHVREERALYTLRETDGIPLGWSLGNRRLRVRGLQDGVDG